MQDPRENLASRLYSGLKDKLYMGATIAGIGLAGMLGSSLYNPLKAQVVTRTIEVEPFNTEQTLTKSSVRYPDDYTSPPKGGAVEPKHWSVTNNRLEVTDYNGSSGLLVYTFNDKLYSFQKTNMALTAAFYLPSSRGDSIKAGITFADDPIAGERGTYYKVTIDSSGNVLIRGTDSYINTTSGSIVPDGNNTLYIRYNNTQTTFKDNQGKSIWPGFNLFINDEKIQTKDDRVDVSQCRDDITTECAIKDILDLKRCEKIGDENYPYLCHVDCDINVNCETHCQANPDTGDLIPETCEIYPDTCETDLTKCPHITNDFMKDMPNLEGYVGVILEDQSVGENDSASLSIIDNFTVEYDQPPIGLGGGLENKLIPHIPKVFLRADSNGDKSFDISDPINTLNYLFTGESKIKCLDAADANDDGQIDLSDAIYSLNFLFSGGKSLPPPFEGGPGIDLTVDNLTDCESDFNWENL